MTDRTRLSRRGLLAGTASTLALGVAHARSRRPVSPEPPPPPPPGDEAFWAQIQSEFTLDRTLSNLNNGGCSPSPRPVHEAYKRYLDQSNIAPPHTMWRQLEPGVEAVRAGLAAEAGCEPDELAITRNASEALQIAQLGLDMEVGDEVITTDQDYPRMRNTWAQRQRREGVVVKTVSFPVPLLTPGPLIDALEAARTPRTKVVHVSHVVFLTGQILPVAEVCAWAREHGITSIVDGAHAFAHADTNLPAMGCDFYGTSLHKWLMAPIGTGFLYVRRDRIAGHWALQPGGPNQDDDIRKFEEIGTHPAAAHNAIAEALVFHRRIGMARKRDRLVALRRRWSEVLREDRRFTVHSPDPDHLARAIGLVEVKGKAPGEVVSALWREHRIIATPIVHEAFQGVRISPNVYTELGELDRLVAAMQDIASA
jgi:selenocysteine lyase/cysteine desulfurase